MSLLWRFGNWVMFLVRNAGHKPPYPFEDDCRDNPLELCIGPWGSTQWRDPTDGSVYEVTTVDDVDTIVTSMERDIYGCTHQEAVEEAERQRKEEDWYKHDLPPRVIRFTSPPMENTG